MTQKTGRLDHVDHLHLQQYLTKVLPLRNYKKSNQLTMLVPSSSAASSDVTASKLVPFLDVSDDSFEMSSKSFPPLQMK